MTIYDINELKQKAIDYLASLRKEGLEVIGVATIYVTEFIDELEKETTKEGAGNEAL